jgi:hypothetical protein
MQEPERVLLCDANVLIDFCEVDKGILTMVAAHICRVAVLTTTLDMVKPLSAKSCRELKVEVLEPSMEDLVTVGANPTPGLAFDDRVMVHVVLQEGYTCVSNDVKARKYLEGKGSTPLWGLDLLLELVGCEALQARRARAAVRALAGISPTHYGPAVLELFEERLTALLGQR